MTSYSVLHDGSDSAITQARQLSEQYGFEIYQPQEKPIGLFCSADKPLCLRAFAGHELDKELVLGEGVHANLWQQDTHTSQGRSLQAPLYKSVGVKKRGIRPCVLDATAGLGADSWRLAAVGCQVYACERHPVIHALLNDALARAHDIAPEIAQNIHLLPCGVPQVDYISRYDIHTLLYDPMFPKARKAKEKKAMRLLRMIVGNDEDCNGVAASFAQWRGLSRLAIKRARVAPELLAQKPQHMFEGKGMRFDVYLIN